MFSPMVATRCVSSSATVRPEPGNGAALIASRSSPTASAICVTAVTKAWKLSLRATKSVSAFTSTIAARPGDETTPTRPSAATRPDFFAAAARPLVRSQSTAASMSPPASVSARLQSIMPAPVLSRSSFTRAAVISGIVQSPIAPGLDPGLRRWRLPRESRPRAWLPAAGSRPRPCPGPRRPSRR